MKENASLVGLLFEEKGNGSHNSHAAELVKRFVLFASWLKADLHLLIQESQKEFVHQVIHEIQNLSRVPITIHTLQKDLVQGVLTTIGDLSMDYLCIEDDDIGSATDSAHSKRELIKKSSIPVLILPKEIAPESIKINTLVVPVSGEQRKTAALSTSLNVADTTHCEVILLHVTQRERQCGCEASGVECVGEQIQHEYRHHLDKIVSAASPTSSLSERQHVTHFMHLSGTTSESIVSFMRQVPRGLLVLEWKGVLLKGHAKTLKAILKSLKSPVLIVKMQDEAHSRLNVGKAFKAA